MFPIATDNNGKRYYDETKRQVTDDAVTNALESMPDDKTILIDSCEKFKAIVPGRNYSLIVNLNCVLDSPIPELSNSFFFGNGNNITIHMESDTHVAIFSKVSNVIFRQLLIFGNIKGKGKCATLALEVHLPAQFLQVALYNNISCGYNSSVDNSVYIGGFAVDLIPDKSSKKFLFDYSISKGILSIDANSVPDDIPSYIGKKFHENSKI